MWMPVTAIACTVTQAPALRPPNDLSHEVPPQAGPTLPGIPALVDADKVLQRGARPCHDIERQYLLETTTVPGQP